MKRSTISWCDYSGGDLNFVTGCTPVSEGCANCYAAAIYKRFGRDFSKVLTCGGKLDRLFTKGFPAFDNVRGSYSRPLCFVCDTGDLFHEAVPVDFVRRAIGLMRWWRTDVDWVILTKRPENIPGDILWPDNVWLGVTAENQEMADKRIPLLLKVPAKVRFVSVEPMLERVDLMAWLRPCTWGCGLDEFGDCLGEPSCPDYRPRGLDWIICGAESGAHRRSFDQAWAESLYLQSRAGEVPFFGKQDSGLRPGRPLLIRERQIQEWPR